MAVPSCGVLKKNNTDSRGFYFLKIRSIACKCQCLLKQPMTILIYFFVILPCLIFKPAHAMANEDDRSMWSLETKSPIQGYENRLFNRTNGHFLPIKFQCIEQLFSQRSKTCLYPLFISEPVWWVAESCKPCTRKASWEQVPQPHQFFYIFIINQTLFYPCEVRVCAKALDGDNA